MNELSVLNMMVAGRMPLKHKFRDEDIAKLIKKIPECSLVNEEISPLLHIRVEKKNGKKSLVSINMTGYVSITGVQSMAEASALYEKFVKDVKKNCRRVLE